MSRYTNWFPGEVKPVRSGLYQRRYTRKGPIVWARHAQKRWYVGCDSPDEAERVNEVSEVQAGFEWRCLKEKAK